MTEKVIEEILSNGDVAMLDNLDMGQSGLVGKTMIHETSTHKEPSPNVLTAAESGKQITCVSVGGPNAQVLPPAIVDAGGSGNGALEFTFFVINANGVVITPDGTDKIVLFDKIGVSGGTLISTDDGRANVLLRCYLPGFWTAFSIYGLWSLETS